MIKTIGTVLLAALVGSGIAYADGNVLSVVSPPADEATGPAKPTPKPAVKKAGAKTPKKTAPKAAKNARKKVAPPAGKGAALLQPSGTKVAKRAKKAATPAVSGEHVEAGLSHEAVEKPASEKHAAEKIVPAVKNNIPGPVYVVFQSNPANAEVVIDGYYAGSTPLQLPVKEGNHQLRVIYPGYEEWERKFNVYKGMRVNALLVQKKQALASP